MGASIQARGRRFQLRLTDRLLPAPFFRTFDTLPQAQEYRDMALSLLGRGILPLELLPAEERAAGDRRSLRSVIEAYLAAAPSASSERDLLAVVMEEVGGVRAAGLSYSWVEEYVRGLKGRRLAPGTIRKRVGALGRVLDWYHLSSSGEARQNPFRLLPRGYSTYSAHDGEPVFDVHRDRRLLPAEEARIRAALAGERRPDRERPLSIDPAFTLLFELIVSTGLRLSEAYRLRWDQVDAARGVLRVEGSKGHRGALKPRVVPLVRSLREALKSGGEGLVFPFWDGTPEGRARTTSKLSARFRGLFDYARVADCTEHDLRHEAACRWFEMRSPDGRWLFSDVEVCRIMGWKDLRMALRYASLRGEDLADRLL